MKWLLSAGLQSPSPGAARECSQACFASSEQVQAGPGCWGGGGPRVGGPDSKPHPALSRGVSLARKLTALLHHRAGLQPLPWHPRVLMPSPGTLFGSGQRSARAASALGPGTGRAACVTHYPGPRWPHPCSSANQPPAPHRGPKAAGSGEGCGETCRPAPFAEPAGTCWGGPRAARVRPHRPAPASPAVPGPPGPLAPGARGSSRPRVRRGKCETPRSGPRGAPAGRRGGAGDREGRRLALRRLSPTFAAGRSRAGPALPGARPPPARRARHSLRGHVASCRPRGHVAGWRPGGGRAGSGRPGGGRPPGRDSSPSRGARPPRGPGGAGRGVWGGRERRGAWAPWPARVPPTPRLRSPLGTAYGAARATPPTLKLPATHHKPAPSPPARPRVATRICEGLHARTLAGQPNGPQPPVMVAGVAGVGVVTEAGTWGWKFVK